MLINFKRRKLIKFSNDRLPVWAQIFTRLHANNFSFNITIENYFNLRKVNSDQQNFQLHFACNFGIRHNLFLNKQIKKLLSSTTTYKSFVNYYFLENNKRLFKVLYDRIYTTEINSE